MTWPLPDSAFIPGQRTRSTYGPVFDAADAAPTITDPAAWRDNQTYLYGIDLHNHGFYWEAHEVWEPVWMGCPPNSRERALMQGLIQVANACLKARMGRGKASDRLAEIARAHLEAAGSDRLMGIWPAKVRNQLGTFVQDGTVPQLDLDWD